MSISDESTKLIRVLFFGREDCDGTRRARTLMNELGFEVTYVESSRRAEPMPQEVSEWRGDFIFSYRSFYILRPEHIERAKIAAINFHPGPPEYPGSGCINFALYDEAKVFGVTAHVMNRKVDNGKILRCRRFPIEVEDTLGTLLKRTHRELEALFIDFLRDLAEDPAAIIAQIEDVRPSEVWRGAARRMSELRSLQHITYPVSETELDRIVRATYIEGFPPTLELHGYRFQLLHDRKGGGNAS